MRTTVLLILLIAVALAISLFVFSKSSYPLTQEDAKKFFLEDLKEKYPGADVREVMEILPLVAQDGTPYYQLKARVTNGLSTPCPERIHVYYDYPPKNFVAQPPEYITKGCKVCINEPNCIIAFPEEAIIASHTYNGTASVENFVKQYSDAKAVASQVDSYGDFSGVWVVKWTSASTPDAYSVVLSKGQNRVLDTFEGDAPDGLYKN